LSVVQERENTSDLLHILAKGQPFDPAINTGSSVASDLTLLSANL
jgi:hypothetical protein